MVSGPGASKPTGISDSPASVVTMKPSAPGPAEPKGTAKLTPASPNAMRLATLPLLSLLGVALVLGGCPRPGTELPPPHQGSSPAPPGRTQPTPTRPSPSEAQGTGSAATAPPARVPSDGREVELQINGERVRVVRPSLTNPFVVAGGDFEPNEPPTLRSTPQADGPTVQVLGQSLIDVIRGVPQTVDLQVTDPDGMGDIVGYYVQFQGYDGYFWVPTEIDSEVFGDSLRQRGRLALTFFMDEVFPPGADRDSVWAAQYDQDFDVTMLVWAVDRARSVSPPVQQMLHVLPVGRGDLEVTLSMSLPSDLDLYVVEPNGNVIYYNNMRSWTNGRLDLDANAACNTNRNVRYEHIFWPEGQVPEGTYQVRVDNWANCVGGQPVDFDVIVQNCGDISVFEGRAEGPGGRADCVNPQQASCQSIATVEVRQCHPQAPTAQAPRLR